MQSNGGLADAASFRGKDAVLSGPAGGVVGMARTAAAGRLRPRSSASTWAAPPPTSRHFAGELRARRHHADRRGPAARARCWTSTPWRRAAARSCPSTASALPRRARTRPAPIPAPPATGAAARSPSPTPTSCSAASSPPTSRTVFGPRRRPAARRRTSSATGSPTSRADRRATGDDRSPEQVAEGFVADRRRQHGPRRQAHLRRSAATTSPEYALTTFGGAGGQHACPVADALGIRTVLVPPAGRRAVRLGIGLADITAMREQAVEAPLDAGRHRPAPQIADDAGSDGPRRAPGRGRARGPDRRHPPGAPALRRHRHRAHRRWPTRRGMPRAFEDASPRLVLLHRARPPDRRRGRLRRSHRRSAQNPRTGRLGPGRPEPTAAPRRPAARDGPHVHRRRLARRAPVAARRAAPRATVTAPRSSPRPARHDRRRRRLAGRVTGDGASGPGTRDGRRADRADARHRQPTRSCSSSSTTCFMSVAEQMGARAGVHRPVGQHQGAARLLLRPLRRRRRPGRQRPAHAGAPGLDGRSVREVIRAQPGACRRGDAYALNDPYHGGTHLPDITVVTPVFDAGPGGRQSDELCSTSPPAATTPRSAASRPGSMPPTSTRSRRRASCSTTGCWSRTAGFREAETRRAARPSRRYPSRDPDTNLADLRAQIAASQKGVDELRAHDRALRPRRRAAYMGHVQDNAAEAVRRVIDALHDGEFAYETGRRRRRSASRSRVDRAGRDRRRSTSPARSPQLATNFNAPVQRRHAAVLYVFRTLVDDDIPLNAGCLQPLNVIIPPGSMLRPQSPAAVVGGQRGDLPGRHRRALRGARRDGRGLRDDEQRHLRQRAATSTTRPWPAAPARATASTAPTWCRPT